MTCDELSPSNTFMISNAELKEKMAYSWTFALFHFEMKANFIHQGEKLLKHTRSYMNYVLIMSFYHFAVRGA